MTMSVPLGMQELCQTVAIPAALLIEIVEHGIIDPPGRGPDSWEFDQHALITCRRAARLQRELELEWSGIALALQLLDDLEQVRRENRQLKSQLGRFLSE
ncbi:chaperone modulator CbpM [Pseudomonas sp. GV071]|uniref:chaperone modulator CbpM n=1 Tax=Pseudomonas sp. GV071 TaxID=2135754 RepID=UPI000D341A2E|nr:chaperone modulator CbpM [Pseudomonas sp. GV071]